MTGSRPRGRDEKPRANVAAAPDADADVSIETHGTRKAPRFSRELALIGLGRTARVRRCC